MLKRYPLFPIANLRAGCYIEYMKYIYRTAIAIVVAYFVSPLIFPVLLEAHAAVTCPMGYICTLIKTASTSQEQFAYWSKKLDESKQKEVTLSKHMSYYLKTNRMTTYNELSTKILIERDAIVYKLGELFFLQ